MLALLNTQFAIARTLRSVADMALRQNIGRLLAAMVASTCAQIQTEIQMQPCAEPANSTEPTQVLELYSLPVECRPAAGRWCQFRKRAHTARRAA